MTESANGAGTWVKKGSSFLPATSQVGGRYAQGFTVFCYGAAGALNALFLKQFTQPGVTQRPGRRFLGNQLLQQGADSGAARYFAIFGFEGGAEKIFELERPPGTGHELAIGDATDGGFMQVQFCSDFAQQQRLHRLRSF